MKALKAKAQYAYFFVRAYATNSYVEWYNKRQETKRRLWTAHGTFGGVVPLGKVSMKEATTAAAKFGTVINVDVECAIVFYHAR